MVKPIIALARELHMRVTVEGVEFVRDAEGDQVQGYFFGRSMPPSRLPPRYSWIFKGTNTESTTVKATDAKLRLIK